MANPRASVFLPLSGMERGPGGEVSSRIGFGGEVNTRRPSDTFVENLLVHVERSIRINEGRYAPGLIADLHERLIAADSARERLGIIQSANLLYSTTAW